MGQLFGHSFGHSLQTLDIDGRINQANGRLKSAKVGITVERRGDRLWLRGTLPPKLHSE